MYALTVALIFTILSHHYISFDVELFFLPSSCSKKLHLDVQSAMAIWCHSLTSLERAVLSLLRCALSGPRVDLQRLDEQVNASLLVSSAHKHYKTVPAYNVACVSLCWWGLGIPIPSCHIPQLKITVA